MIRATLAPFSLGLLAFALYLASLPPSFAFWDTGELQTVATILGIAHPPACPAFVLVGWLFAHAIPVGEAAWRVNLMCALAIAVAVGLLYATARRFAIAPPLAALLGVGFATASVVWKDATRAEIQDLALLFRILVFVFGFAYARDGRRRDLFCAALALGLAAATHGTAILMLPAFVLLVVARRTALRMRDAGLVVAGVALGIVPYVYLPLRSAWLYAHAVDPTLGLGLPPGMAFWDYDHPATWRNFVRVVTGEDFDVHSGFAGFLDVGRYPQYARALFTRLAAAYGIVGAIAATYGALVLVASREPARIALVLIAFAVVPYTESYSALQDPDRYYLIALWCGALAIGVAVEAIARALRPAGAAIARRASFALLVVSFALAAPARLELFAQRDDYGARTYARAIVARVPDDAIVVADWAYATPLAYVAYVERTFGHRIVIAASPAQYVAYFPRWLASRPIYIVSFDDALSLRGYAVDRIAGGAFNLYRITREGRRS